MSDADRRAQLKGKRILIPGAGHLEKSFIIERALELGCKIVVADLPDSYAKDMEGIELFIEVRVGQLGVGRWALESATIDAWKAERRDWRRGLPIGLRDGLGTRGRSVLDQISGSSDDNVDFLALWPDIRFKNTGKQYRIIVTLTPMCFSLFAKKQADMLSHETAAEEVATKVKATGLQFDGIYNFWEVRLSRHLLGE